MAKPRIGSRLWTGMAWRLWPASAIGFNWTFGNCSPEGQRRLASAVWDAWAFMRGNLQERTICDRPARGRTRGIPLSLDITRSFP